MLGGVWGGAQRPPHLANYNDQTLTLTDTAETVLSWENSPARRSAQTKLYVKC